MKGDEYRAPEVRTHPAQAGDAAPVSDPGSEAGSHHSVQRGAETAVAYRQGNAVALARLDGAGAVVSRRTLPEALPLPQVLRVVVTPQGYAVLVKRTIFEIEWFDAAGNHRGPGQRFDGERADLGGASTGALLVIGRGAGSRPSFLQTVRAQRPRRPPRGRRPMTPWPSSL